MSELTHLVDFVGTDCYEGWAYPGTKTSSSKWKIKKIEAYATDALEYWADHDDRFVKCWDSRITGGYAYGP